MEGSHASELAYKEKRNKSLPRSNSLRCSSGKGSRKLFGLCCVCRKTPQHSKKYYGHLFCVKCFQKYIWTAPNGEIKSFSYEDLTKYMEQLNQLLGFDSS